jgi:hypothetical protein
MATVQVTVQLTSEELLKAVEQLSLPELEQFVSQVLELQAHRRAPYSAEHESELLFKINNSLPHEVRARYRELVAKRQADTLTTDEHNELLRLNDQVEESDARRLEYIAELARLRNVTPKVLLQELSRQASNVT